MALANDGRRFCVSWLRASFVKMLVYFTSSVVFLSLLPFVYSQVNSTFWVQTAIYSANPIQMNNATVQAQFETSLMTAYTQAYTLQAASSSTVGRRKRLATSTLTSSLQLQLVNISINSTNTAVYYLTYYVLFSGTPFSATTVCSTLNQLNIQQMALTLGYLIVQECSIYLQASSTTSDAQYWVLGTCVGVLCGVVFLVCVILIAVCACSDSSCVDDKKASNDGVFAPKNSAIYLDEVEAILIEEEFRADEQRKVADELLRTASIRSGRKAGLGQSYKYPNEGDNATIAQKVAEELKPQIETMMAKQKSDLEEKVVNEVRNGVRRMEKQQKKQLDELNKNQKELIEANASRGVLYLNPDETHVLVVDDKRQGDAGNAKRKNRNGKSSPPEQPNDAVELDDLDQVKVRKRKRQEAKAAKANANAIANDAFDQQNDDDAKPTSQDAELQRETAANNGNAPPETDTNTLSQANQDEQLAQTQANAMPNQPADEITNGTVTGLDHSQLPPRPAVKKTRPEPKRFNSELRVTGGDGSYMKHLEETGRRPGGPLPSSKDAVDVATVGLALERDAGSLRATLASL